jgi:FkbM family methyltransferase
MNLLSLFRYPAYVYNPRQVLARLRREFGKSSDNEIIRLPWGHRIMVNSNDFIGQAIASHGIHEIDVCEAIARLVREGDTVVDVGANVGFMTSLLARAVGKTGRVLAFEPHPKLYSRLRANINRFDDGRSGRVTAEPVALSDRGGEDWLVFDSGLFERNSGTAGLRDTGFAHGKESVMVWTDKLDTFISGKTVALLKLDVEGAELRVLSGAALALAERRIMAIVYEDFNSATSGIVSYLTGFGFSVYHLDGNLIRPFLCEVDEGFRQIPRGRDENFLAVLDPQVLLQAYRRLGWRVFNF